MKVYNDCYRVVRKKCFKFIKSQETSKEKFKNKEKMIRDYLIPVSFWISEKCKSKPYYIGLAGGQGTGKTTISSILKIILINYFKLNVFKISIDDFYKTRKDRINLSKRIHPMLLTRGVPGTHDIKMMLEFFKNSKKKKFKKMKLPLFDKSIDDRLPKKKWYEIKKRPDVIILEGWCVGAKAQTNQEIKKSMNSMEKLMDKELKWRKFVNYNLQTSYKKLFKQLDTLLYLKASNFNQLRKWRLKQEKKLKIQTKNKKNLKIMDKKDVISFMQTYQRITENMFKNVPKYASIVMNLNSSHQIKSVIYKK